MSGGSVRRPWPALVLLAVAYAAALGAPWLAPHDPLEQHRDHSFAAPGADFPLGADRFGRDQLSRLLHGARVSLGAGLLAALLAVGIGLAAGLAAGYHGGVLDGLVMRAAELSMSLPWLYLLLAVRAFLPLDTGPVEAFLLVVALIGAVGWSGPARLVRGVALSARERPYVTAARGFGAGGGYLIRRHVLPATLGPALTQLALLAPRYVVAEVTLSFLGLGVAEPHPSWGNMLSAASEAHTLLHHPWILSPAAALAAVVVSYHQLASALQARWSTGSR